MKNEIWKPVLCWETSHEVSSFGRVRSLRRGQILKSADNGYGYHSVVLWTNAHKSDERKRTAKVHRIVLESFTRTKSPGMDAAHLDGNRTNNRLDNLAWKTRSANHADKHRHGKGDGRKNVPRDKLTAADAKAILKLTREGWSAKALSTHFGVTPGNILHIRKGRTWKGILAFKGESK